MKKTILILAFFAITGAAALAQAPPPPPSDPSNGGGPVGSISAPIDDGLTIFLAFAIGCMAWQWKMRKPANG